jgi:hypothetical protein
LEVEVEDEILDTRFMNFNPKKIEIIKPQKVFYVVNCGKIMFLMFEYSTIKLAINETFDQ